MQMKRDELTKSAGNVGLLSNNLRQTKINFDLPDFQHLYKGMDTEKVWIDFGKANTNVKRYNPMTCASELNFEGHKLYYMLPPSLELIPSNIIIFELLYLSSKSTCKDEVKAWGAFPVVNGDFEINAGKFKVPLLFGDIDFSTNKFKDIEQKYNRNIDEWLCNLYIQVKKIELFDFRYHEEKIEFVVPKKYKKLLDQQAKNAKLLTDMASRSTEHSDNLSKSTLDEDTPKHDKDSDYSSSDHSTDSDLDYGRIADLKAN